MMISIPIITQDPRSSKRWLLLLLAFLFLTNVAWFTLGGAPLHWDSSVHLLESLNANRIGSENVRPFWKQALNISWYYPPFVSYATVPFYRLLGESEFAGFAAITCFLLILVSSVYGIAHRLFDPGVAFLSAFLIAMCPIVITFSRDFMLDLPLASMVALSMFLMLESREFTNTRVSLLLGVCLGCGFLTRWTFPFFLIVPISFEFARSVRKNAERFRRVCNFFLAMLVGTIISFPWYAVHIIQILTERSGELARGDRSTLENIFYYLGVLPEQVSWLLIPALIAGIALFRRKHHEVHHSLLTWFIGSYVAISLMAVKGPRLSLPLLPPVIILASAGLIEARNHVSGKLKFAPLVVFAVALVQYFLITFVPATSGIGRALSHTLVTTPIVPVQGPNSVRWQQQEILETIHDQQPSRDSRAILRVIPDHVHFNRQTFEYLGTLQHFNIVISGITGFPLFTDYVVVKTDDNGQYDVKRQTLSALVTEDSRQQRPLFTEIKRFHLPDESEAILFQVTPQRVDSITDTVLLQTLEREATQFIRKYLRSLEGNSLRIEVYDSAETTRGHIKSLHLQAEKGELGDFNFTQHGLRVTGIDVDLFDIVFDPVALMARDTLAILSLGGLHINGMSIAAADMRNYVALTSGGKTVVEQLSMEDGALSLAIHQLKPDFRISARVRIWRNNDGNISFAFDGFRLSSCPISPLLVNTLTVPFDPLLGGFGFLSDFKAGDITLSNDELTIGRGKGI